VVHPKSLFVTIRAYRFQATLVSTSCGTATVRMVTNKDLFMSNVEEFTPLAWSGFATMILRYTDGSNSIRISQDKTVSEAEIDLTYEQVAWLIDKLNDVLKEE